MPADLDFDLNVPTSCTSDLASFNLPKQNWADHGMVCPKNSPPYFPFDSLSECEKRIVSKCT